MNKEDVNIVFYGTPEFAVPSLDALVMAGFGVKAVVTAPDRPAGRGLGLVYSPVKDYCLLKGIEILQPEDLSDRNFLTRLNNLHPDLQIVVAFRKLPKPVWELPALGTFNLHASLLPQYRGAAPINWVLINGETKTGLTTFFIDEHIDTGSILLQREMQIAAEDDAGTLHDRMMVAGSELVLETAALLLRGEASPYSQPVENPEHLPLIPAPKIYKVNCEIDWNQNTAKIINLVRGLSPYPGAFTYVSAPEQMPLNLKIFKAMGAGNRYRTEAGKVIPTNNGRLIVGTSDGALEVVELQLAGKKRMNAQEFLRGYVIKQGLMFGHFGDNTPEKA